MKQKKNYFNENVLKKYKIKEIKELEKQVKNLSNNYNEKIKKRLKKSLIKEILRKSAEKN